MTTRPDIWYHLKDHAILPPGEVGNRLRAMLETENLVRDPVLGIIERVRDHEVTPPVGLDAIVGERCGLQIPGRPGRRAAFYNLLRRRYVAAAACLLLVAVAWIVVVRKGKPSVVPSAAPSVTRASSPDTASERREEVKDMAVAAKPDSDAASKPDRRLPFSVEGEAIHVSDNDLLTSFSSYTYPEVPDYLLRESEQPLKIYVDQYTNIYVSKNMRAQLKDLYEVRNNGKPTRKARRARRRLDDWKKKDEKRWDKGEKANPLDPVDLGEFIFK